jgi:hypothetical protein
MLRALENIFDLTILGMDGSDSIIGLSGSKPIDNMRWRPLRHLGDHLLRDIGLERRANRYLP